MPPDIGPVCDARAPYARARGCARWALEPVVVADWISKLTWALPTCSPIRAACDARTSYARAALAIWQSRLQSGNAMLAWQLGDQSEPLALAP
eukprot:5629854-Pyramimonas_sp.AAC.3